jgi:hypothetical protein
MRSTLQAGSVTLTATRQGLKPATVSFDTKPVQVMDGLSQEEEVTLSPVAAK